EAVSRVRLWGQGSCDSWTTAPAELLVTDRDHLEHRLAAIRRQHDAVARALADQRLAEARIVGDAVLKDVCLVSPYEVVDLPLSRLVLELEARAQAGDGARAGLMLDDDGSVDQFFQVGDA